MGTSLYIGETPIGGVKFVEYGLTNTDKNLEVSDVAADAKATGDAIKQLRKEIGNANFQTDETLKFQNGVLSVNTSNQMEQDNTLPITSAAVFTTVGNIESLLKTI